jgi:hypothetical protein
MLLRARRYELDLVAFRLPLGGGRGRASMSSHPACGADRYRGGRDAIMDQAAVEPTLRASRPNRARRLVLVIDYFASRRCTIVIGDLTGDFRDAPPGTGYVELARIEGVRLFAESRWLGLLGDAGPGVRLGGPRSPGTGRSSSIGPNAGSTFTAALEASSNARPGDRVGSGPSRSRFRSAPTTPGQPRHAVAYSENGG